MAPYIVWIDHEQAKAIPIAPLDARGPTEPIHTHAHRVDHHTHAQDNLDREKRTRKMFQETARSLGEAERILIVGPGLAKHLFNNYLAEHFPRVFRKVAGCEALDHPSEPQIRAFGKRYFQELELKTVELLREEIQSLRQELKLSGDVKSSSLAGEGGSTPPSSN